MDFLLTDEQQEIAGLVARILGEQVTPERLRAVEDTAEPVFDRRLWSTLADAGLLGVAIPAEHGGLGFGLTELCLVLEEAGRTVAPVPLLATLVGGALPVARFGTETQRTTILPPIAAGERIVTAALVEPESADVLRPATTARRDGDGWVLSGHKTCVPAGLFADTVLVSAATPDGTVGLFLVEAAARGVTRRPQRTISDATEASVDLDGVAVGDDAVVGPIDAASTVIGWLADRLTAGVCSLLVGVTEAALRLTAEYVTTRQQFGRPLAGFQAVGQRAADAFIDAWSIRLATLQAVWALDTGLPVAKELAVAKLYAAEAGQRVARAAQHLHGGVGMDRDYPLHRYTLTAKQLELTLGGGGRHVEALGRLLADECATA
ncbi:MAG TPA: acyl-CoA dehydrogenase family protein [Acidimicrobiia bacterium]|nr:acyl-CoA dehydrogenase family protein [Acidimicrobiia bacterium]